MKVTKLLTDFPDTEKKMLRFFYRVFNRRIKSIRTIQSDNQIQKKFKQY